MSDTENDIHVEVDVPAPEAEPEVEAPAAVVVVNDTPAPDPSPGDGVLTALLSIESRLAQLENAVIQTAEIAVDADIKADTALSSDVGIQEEILAIEAEVAEALEEDQAPAEADESPKKTHWLHR